MVGEAYHKIHIVSRAIGKFNLNNRISAYVIYLNFLTTLCQRPLYQAAITQLTQ